MISLCIPAYRRERMLRQCLHSVLMQDYDDYEIIVRDDDRLHPVIGDPEVERLMEFIGPKLHYYAEDHLGTYSAVANETLKYASGDIVGMLASDDLLAPNALKTIAAAFEQERFGGPYWIYGRTVSVDENLRYQSIDGHKTTYEDLRQKNCIGCPSTFWNRKMMNVCGNFDLRFKWAADYDLWLRFWRQQEPLFIEEPIGVFRHHAQQMSKEQAEEIENEAKVISFRHTAFPEVIRQARQRHTQTRIEVPQAHE